MTARKRVASGIAAVAAGLLLQSSWSPGSPAAAAAANVDRNLVAVLPFRVADATPALADLRDWLQELLVTRLTGEGVPRALSPRDVASALRRSPGASRRLRNDLGVAMLLSGQVAGTPTRLEIAATLEAGGATQAEAQVVGNPDSLPYLADRLIVRLLAARSAEGAEERAAFAATSLAALRAYLAGREAYRRGMMHDAEEYLDRALLLDSMFAPAALGVATLQSNFWHWGGGDLRWLADATWNRRHRMSPGERALLVAYFGPHYPGPATAAEMVAAAERATLVAPMQLEAWFTFGKYLRWFGSDIGPSDWKERSIAALGRAFALDSTHALTLEGLIMMATAERDTAAARRYLRLYLAHNANVETQASVEWLAADALGDSAARKALRAQFARLGETNLFRINWWGQTRGGVAVEDAVLAINALLAHYSQEAGNPSNRGLTMSRHALLLFNQGRPTEATRVLGQFRVGSYVWRDDVGPRELRLYADLFWDGDHGDAVVAARQLEASADSAAHGTADADAAQAASCALAQWWAASGSWDRARAALARIDPRAAPGDFFGVPGTAICAAAGQAMVAAGTHQATAPTLVARLDSLLRAPWWNGDYGQTMIGNLIAARLHETRGDVRRALEAVRRVNDVHFLSTKLREEGRLAAQVGDRSGAIRAYRHYLALRSNPEPALRPEVERVRAALRRLEAGDRRN